MPVLSVPNCAANADLPGIRQALAAMRQDFQRITADLSRAPMRLIPYRDGRVQRFLQNYDLILTAEESAAQGQSGQCEITWNIADWDLAA